MAEGMGSGYHLGGKARNTLPEITDYLTGGKDGKDNDPFAFVERLRELKEQLEEKAREAYDADDEEGSEEYDDMASEIDSATDDLETALDTIFDVINNRL